MSLAGLDQRFLEADSRVAEWSMGGAMFGLTAAVVQMLIRSLIVRRENVRPLVVVVVLLLNIALFQLNRRVGSRRMDQERRFISQRKSDVKKRKSVKPFKTILNHHSPLMVDEDGGVVTHVFTYPYVIPVYYNFGKYDLNSLNQDYFRTSTIPPTTTTESPWDRMDDIELPDTLHENMHSVFSVRNKQYITEKDPTVRDEKKDYSTNDEDYDEDFIKRTNAYLSAYFKHVN